MSLALIFDTETTGFPKSKTLSKDTVHLYPYIVQISYIIYNTETNEIVKIRDYIVKLPKNIIMSDECINIHGITNLMSQEKGIDISIAIDEFLEDVKKSNIIIAHNMSFDLNIVNAELVRLINSTNMDPTKIQNYVDFARHLKTKTNLYCTMQESTALCNIRRLDKNGKEYVKFPKLVELHEILFKTTPKNLHNSLNDVIVCLRCFYKMNYDTDILDTNNELQKLYEKLVA